MDEAQEVVKWFNNHGRALGMLKEEQRANPDILQILALVLPVLTRWTSHYLCCRRLLELEKPIRCLVINQTATLLICAGEKADAIAKARTIIAIIERDSFWTDLKMCVALILWFDIQTDRPCSVKSHLEPFAVAANITQGDTARLDVVLLTLANLYRIFTQPTIDPAVRIQVLQSLEKRWKKTDQHVFLLAVVFNPYLRTSCFHHDSPYRTMGKLWPVIRQVYKDMFNSEPNLDFRTTFAQYLDRTGDWSDVAMDLAGWKAMAVDEVRNLTITLSRTFTNANSECWSSSRPPVAITSRLWRKFKWTQWLHRACYAHYEHRPKLRCNRADLQRLWHCSLQASKPAPS